MPEKYDISTQEGREFLARQCIHEHGTELPDLDDSYELIQQTYDGRAQGGEFDPVDLEDEDCEAVQQLIAGATITFTPAAETTTEWGVRSLATPFWAKVGETEVKPCSSREHAVQLIRLFFDHRPGDLYRHENLTLVHRQVTPWETDDGGGE